MSIVEAVKSCVATNAGSIYRAKTAGNWRLRVMGDGGLVCEWNTFGRWLSVEGHLVAEDLVSEDWAVSAKETA